jgi:thiol-disulfide isomerase/thioredoxin
MAASSTPNTKPALFQDLPFAEAAARTEHDERLLLVDATASWCMPCQMMDRNTWIDVKVVDWLQQHALAIQIDVDAESEVAKQLNIRSMPTVIAFRQGKELDRVVGAKTPTELIDWLEGIMRGERNVDRLRAEVARTEGETGAKDIEGRLQLARALLLAGELDAATEAFRWLWDHTLEDDAGAHGMRVMMTFDMGTLAESYPPARQAFTVLRDQTAERLSTSAGEETQRADWIALNRALGETDRTIAWFEQASTREGISKLSPLAAYALEELLLSLKRWSDVAILYPDPMAWLKEQGAMLTVEFPPMPDMAEQPDFHAMHVQMFRDSAARVYAVLLAAGRDVEAGSVAEEVRRMEPSGELTLALVSAACETGQPRTEHWTWIDAPAVRDLADCESVRKQLQSSEASIRRGQQLSAPCP